MKLPNFDLNNFQHKIQMNVNRFSTQKNVLYMQMVDTNMPLNIKAYICKYKQQVETRKGLSPLFLCARHSMRSIML